MKKIFIISISAILGMFTQIDSSYAAGGCGIRGLDTSIAGTAYGYTRLNGNAGSKESNYGLTRGSGQWAVQFSYGTVWGMARCSSTGGNNNTYTWPESSQSQWLKTNPINDSGQYCWCQATGFSQSGSNYTSGPQCTVSPVSNEWVFAGDKGTVASCKQSCAFNCAQYTYSKSALRVAMFGAVPADSVGLNWYDGDTPFSGGASSCTLGGTFTPPSTTPPARPGYVFAGWRAVQRCGINNLDTSTNGRGSSYYGYAHLDGSTGSNESNYGLTVGSGQWAVEFSYGTVWGMAKCSSTSGSNSSYTYPESSKSNWLKTPSDTTGRYCWCQTTGFTASGNSYTSGPQCTTAASSLWVFSVDFGKYANCASGCAFRCASNIRDYAAFRAGVYGAVGQ